MKTWRLTFAMLAVFFSVEGHNLLHTRNYRRLRVESQNDYNEVITENRLPGYVIAGAKYMF
ncbi:MAG: hypothetical protein IJM78_08785 [Prevotella sp.]|nr:hypothetical protein [Prevotella sp.]